MITMLILDVNKYCDHSDGMKKYPQEVGTPVGGVHLQSEVLTSNWSLLPPIRDLTSNYMSLTYLQ